MAELTFGNVPHPPFIDAIVSKPYDGAGYTRVAPRKNIGVCVHAWAGHAWTTPAWRSIYDLMSGERLYDALVDYSVQRDGSIVRLNNPEGTRSPYANGGSDGLEGDGVAFVRARGIFGINAELVSIEHENNGEAMPDVQLEASGKLQAHFHDRAKQAWSDYPFHATYGIVTSIQHFEFAVKSCPMGGIRGQTDEYQNYVRGLLKAGQTAVQPAPTPPPVPVENPGNTTWPNGWQTAELAKRFGQLLLIDAAGKSSRHTFDAQGQISNAWVARCAKSGITAVSAMPRPVRWNRIDTTDGRVDVIVFDVGNAPDWVLYNPKAGDRAGYRWLA